MTRIATILCSIDLDSNSANALDYAGYFGRQSNARVVVLHVVPITLNPEDAPMYAELYQPKAEEARQKIGELAHRHLRDVKYEIRTEIGQPWTVIVDMAARLPADLLVMSTHRRRFARFLLGSVAEKVMREVLCPVLTVKNLESDRFSVGQWMSANPVTVAPGDPIVVAQRLMHEGNFRTLPVVKAGKLIGIVTDRDLRTVGPNADHVTVEQAMTRDLFTITAETSVFEASRLLGERKVGALPVMQDAQLIGILSTEDLLKAFAEIR